MDDRLIKNPEVKGLIIKFSIALILIIIANVFYIKAFFTHMNSQVISRDISVIGSLLSKHPELEGDIISSFTKESSQADIKTGTMFSKKYGYDTSLPLGITPIMGKNYYNLLMGSTLNMVFSLLVIFILFYFFLRFIYKRLNNITGIAEGIIEGDFSLKLDESKEGSFAKLSHQFNQMSKNLEMSLNRLKEEKFFLKDMISDISHQLKTPLSSLKMFNELLLDDDVDREKQREFLIRSGQQLDRIEWLIINLLKMARLEAGAIEFHRQRQNIVTTIKEVVESHSERIQIKNQSIEIKCPLSEVCLSYDEGWMGEAVSNIIKNSIEHTGSNGKINIEVMESPVMVRIDIKDNGEGIDEEDIPHIYERFYKGKNNLHGEGTGIGLALAKTIIEGQSGIISVRSTKGRGTSFSITFLKGII